MGERNPEQSENFERKPAEDGLGEVHFNDLELGDVLIVTAEGGKTYKITVMGNRKDGLCVSVRESSAASDDVEEYTARMPGGFTMFREGGINPGTLKVKTGSEENCLYFERGKDHHTKERLFSSLRTTGISRITLKKKESVP